jgi:predicted dehydrogenase
MNGLVIGYGSIGTRHSRILKELGCEVAVVSRRQIQGVQTFHSLYEAVHSFSPDYVVIANETSCHSTSLKELVASGYQGKVLVEKPLFDFPQSLDVSQFQSCYVAYNLRFHPLMQRLNDLVPSVGRVISVQVYAGQYLPFWRPGTDYRKSYSSQKAKGGGVLRDLSHELDYVHWLFGGWKELTALGGKYSSLEIDSDDAFTMLMSTDRCPMVSVHLNYLDRVSRREILIQTDEQVIHADLIRGILNVNGSLETYAVERDDTYREMHRQMLLGTCHGLCTYEDGVIVLEMIEAAERAATERKWVTRCL